MGKLSFLRKITAPALPTTIVQRTSLIQRLHEAIIGNCNDSTVTPSRYKLILVDAPAGYGKTTLLATFAQQCPLPCCWYLLDSDDTQPVTFLQSLFTSLRQQFPTFGKRFDKMFNKVQTSIVHAEAMLAPLVEALAAEISTRFVLFLCNYQEINDCPDIVRLIGYLLHHLPEQCVLVLESRVVPELDFASLLANRTILGVGQDLLRFSPQEIQELARLQGNQAVSEEEAEQIVATFDGWITGILLGTYLGEMRYLQSSSVLPSSYREEGMPIHTQTIFSYVINEVFKRHQEVYNFLKEVVVLQEMTPLLCAALLEIPETEASQRLHYLEQHRLFVMQCGTDVQPRYACHPMLRELLSKQLRQQMPDRFVQLHQQAAHILSEDQCYDQAIYHAMEAKEDEVAAELLIKSAEQMVEQGHSETVERWILAFSPTTIRQYPQLLLIHVDILLRKSELSRSFSLFETIADIINDQSFILSNNEHLPILQAELTLAHTQALIQQGKYQQAYSLCKGILERLPADEVHLRAKAHRYCGSCAEFLGNLVDSIANYQKALQLWGRHTISRHTADGHTALTNIYRMLGHFALAEHHSTRATACWEQLQDAGGNVYHLLALAKLKRDQGQFNEAEAILQQALMTSSSTGLCRLQGAVLVSLGELYQDQGLYNRSLSTTEDALALARHVGDFHLLHSALRTLALTYLYIGDTVTAILLLSEGALEESREEQPCCSIEHLLQKLSMGTILLYQRHYTEARTALEQAEDGLRTIGFKREHLKAVVRLAACLFEEKRVPEALKYLAIAQDILSVSENYEHCMLTELRMLPRLQRTIQKLPECADLQAIFQMKTGKQNSQTEEQSGFQENTVLSSLLLTHTSFSSAPSAPRLKLLAFGEPVVLFDEQPITCWRMARAMELCFYLLDCPRPLRKEQIISALWTEMDEPSFQTFYSTIHYLRKALGGKSVITSKAGMYTLDLVSIYGEESVWYDVAVFEEQYTVGKQALLNEDEEGARQALERVVKLYRGDYAQSFYSNWTRLRRDELRRTYLDAHLKLASLAWRSGSVEKSAMHWQQMLAVDDCLEEAHCGLMRCYLHQGNRGLALRQYQRCAETLQRELGALPGPALQNFYEKLIGTPTVEAKCP